MFNRVMAVAIFMCPIAANATSKVEQIRARGKLIVSVKNDAKKPHKDPAHFQKRGFEVELAQALARHIVGDESRLELKMLARPVRLPMLAAGVVDLVVSMIPMTAENVSQCDFSHPYFSSGLSLLLRQLAIDEAGRISLGRRLRSERSHSTTTAPSSSGLQTTAGSRSRFATIRPSRTLSELSGTVRRLRWAATSRSRRVSQRASGLRGQRAAARRAARRRSGEEGRCGFTSIGQRDDRGPEDERRAQALDREVAPSVSPVGHLSRVCRVFCLLRRTSIVIGDEEARGLCPSRWRTGSEPVLRLRDRCAITSLRTNGKLISSDPLSERMVK